MNVQKRLLLFFFLLFLLFSAGLVLYLRIERTHLLKIQNAEVKEREQGFEKILKLDQQAIFVLANDYSYWDELVSAIKHDDQAWARINIDSGIKTYQADGAWVYNMDAKMIYSVNRFSDERLKTLPLNKTQIEQIFGKQALAHFFIATPAGYLELQGATVHPSNDSERKTPPQGYIFAGKLWDQEHLKTLSQLTNCSLSVLSTEELANPSEHKDRFLINVDDWNQKLLFTIAGTVNSEGIQRFQAHSRIFLKMFLLYTSIQVLFLLYFLRRFFKEPRKKTQ